jgi:hypothetical protein
MVMTICWSVKAVSYLGTIRAIAATIGAVELFLHCLIVLSIGILVFVAAGYI